jgi:hypothetical protein
MLIVKPQKNIMVIMGGLFEKSAKGLETVLDEPAGPGNCCDRCGRELPRGGACPCILDVF